MSIIRPVQFAPFTDKDFETYSQEKWQSNVFNRQRMEIKQNLLALGRILSPNLVGADGALLECEASVEYPALWNQRRVQNQHLFFSRNKDARQELHGIISKKRTMAALIDDPSPLRHHILLSLMIDQHQAELALKLHSDAAVDRDNLDRLSQDFFTLEKLVSMIVQLPGEFEVGMVNEDGPQGEVIPAPDLSEDALRQLVQDLPGADSWFTIRHSISSDDAIVRGGDFPDFAGQQLGCLLPVMHFIAWSRDNDFISIKETLKEKEIQQKSKGLKKGDVIRVKQGMFAGKTGKVQEVDGKGKMKVRLGTLLVNLDGEDLDKV